MELRDYQKKDLEFHLSRDRSLNLSMPGTGKSAVFSRFIYTHYLIDGTKLHKNRQYCNHQCRIVGVKSPVV